jgi:nucleoside 2-deoxyribosyltransferase
MMRFRDTPQHTALITSIRETLAKYGLNLVRADWQHFKDELWANVCHCMETSTYGIAIFEQIDGLATSPNVSLELGYMLTKGRHCLLLKEQKVQMLQADLAGHLCRPFDVDRIEESVEPEVHAWFKDLGITKRTDERLLIP